MTTHERLHLLFDQGLYDELFRFIQHNSTSFGMAGKDLPADGVVTGLGAIRGRLVYASSQDFTVMCGSVGWMHPRKICEIMDMPEPPILPLTTAAEPAFRRESIHSAGMVGYFITTRFSPVSFRRSRSSPGI